MVNVYTPDVSGKRKMPVMVWIHGGGFTTGSGNPDMYGPEYIMDAEVVLVTLNYRLGPLGFLGMGDDVFPGNLGLWDQNLALKWVQKNIEAFGGDANRVTVRKILSPSSSYLDLFRSHFLVKVQEEFRLIFIFCHPTREVFSMLPLSKVVSLQFLTQTLTNTLRLMLGLK